jgi:hypothetical protein
MTKRYTHNMKVKFGALVLLGAVALYNMPPVNAEDFKRTEVFAVVPLLTAEERLGRLERAADKPNYKLLTNKDKVYSSGVKANQKTLRKKRVELHRYC